MSGLEQLSKNRMFGGEQLRYRHSSTVNNCDMTFAIYLPPQAATKPVPVLYWLSGLTCTDENFTTKAGAQRVAAELGIAIVCPDTSPRGEDVPDDDNGSYDFGLGAGFYVNATESPWRKHYQMQDYVVKELPELLAANFPINIRSAGIAGHSMGGHGAITLGLLNPERYCSISAFAPICSPTRCPWGQKALGGYLGNRDNNNHWLMHDSAHLVETSATQLPLLVDQGDADNFLAEQLLPHLIIEAAEKSKYPLTFRMQQGYDHSYYFIASFIEEHLRFHARHMN